MRELERLRQRLLAAMGIVAVATIGCSGSDTGASGGKVDTTVGSDTGATSDGANSDSSAQDSSAADSVTADAAVSDTSAQDGGGTDAVVDVVEDVAKSDADAAADADADAATTDGAVSDVPTADAGADVLGGVSCDFGTAQQQCFTAAELAWAVDMQFGGGAPVDAGSSDADAGSTKDYPVPPEGCPAKERVFDGCCNPAQGGPIMVGETCCYAFCVGGCCGRPLVIDGAQQIAPTGDFAGWRSRAQTTADSATLDATTRAALVRAWAEDAALEHASIASFARFGLELLRFGAPADLCADAARAAGDEVAHAEACFAIASVLGGTTMGPGPLPLGDAVPLAPDLEAAIASTIVEGCVGETFAAALARAAAEAACEPMIAASLQEIAADEARHAELAWRFVRWGLDVATPEAARPAARRAAAGAFAEALRRLPEAHVPAGVDIVAWQACGRLTPQRQRALVLATAREVIGPCAEALLGEAVVEDAVARA